MGISLGRQVVAKAEEVAPLTFIAEFRTPYAPVSEIEENS
jgi:hypothetical protein